MFELDWKQIEGHWCFRTQEYTGVAWLFIVLDNAILSGTEIDAECNPFWKREVGIESCYDNGGDDEELIRMIVRVQEFVENPFKQRHIKNDHGNLFLEGIQVGHKRALWKEIFEDIHVENWLRIVERGPYDVDSHHYSHVHCQMIPAQMLATIHPRQAAMEQWFPHHLRPLDLLTDKVMVVNYGHCVLDLSPVPEILNHYKQ